uniref:Uncharacterized protein n=1 Tax=Sus scrofa TaxID=9823 RepID=A0A8D0UVZ1_PIG
MKLEHSLTPYTKINSKRIKDLDITSDTIKLLEENIGQTLSDINNSNVFSDPPLRVLTIKIKINKWDLIKLKSFCTAKETLNKTKRQPQNGRTSLQINQLTRDSSPKFINNFCSSIPKKQTTPIKTWAEDLNRQFSKEDIWMAKKHMKRCSTSLVSREMQIKTTMRYLPPYTSQNGHHPKVYKQEVLQRVGRKRNPSTLLVGL